MSRSHLDHSYAHTYIPSCYPSLTPLHSRYSLSVRDPSLVAGHCSIAATLDLDYMSRSHLDHSYAHTYIPSCYPSLTPLHSRYSLSVRDPSLVAGHCSIAATLDLDYMSRSHLDHSYAHTYIPSCYPSLTPLHSRYSLSVRDPSLVAGHCSIAATLDPDYMSRNHLDHNYVLPCIPSYCPMPNFLAFHPV